MTASGRSAPRGEAMMLNNGQCHAVDAAEPSMTAEQLDRLARRMNTVSFKHGPLERSPSKEEGTSKRLGKTVDPRNWGAVDIEPDELDPEYQRQAFEFYSKFRTLQHERLLSTSDMEAHDPIEPLSDPEVWDNSKHAELDETPADSPALPLGFEGVACSEHEAVLTELAQLRQLVGKLTASPTESRGRSVSAAEKAAVASRLSAEIGTRKVKASLALKDSKVHTQAFKQGESLRPINQVALTSYLGKAFADLGRLSSSARESSKLPRVRMADSSESSDDHDPSSSSNESSCEDSSTASGTGAQPQRKKKHTRKKSKVPMKRPSLKPREPTAYDGRADVQDFHKFMRESIEYVTGYDLDKERYVSTLSSFLKGKAYRFFSMQVSTKDPNFRLKVRDSLRNRFQGRLTVQEYACELEELFMMAGVISDEEKVIKLWYGLHGYIQKELWRFELSPTVSSWEDVRAAATRFELAEAQLAERFRMDRTNPRDIQALETDPVSGGLMALVLGTLQTSHSPPALPLPTLTPRRSGERPLSEKEKAELKAAGKCFHYRRGKPPGITTYSMELDDDRANPHHRLSETTATAAGVSLNSIELGGAIESDDESGSEEDDERSLRSWVSGNIADGGNDDLLVPHHVLNLGELPLPPPIELPMLRNEGRPYVRFDDPYARQAMHLLKQHVPTAAPA
ncbi:hypothetical protein EW026_g8103 [Hermanssonia centrifuga]|uniref:Retrotransposon gag domain-containing protein n=1 Tax=Hermanssonia centrifuga TaxID=98765 RepID=A0A4S4K5H4_9APHY|nr:hypothetical protein EW026_g8103 [Hermanssonia centrifuga]